MVQPIDRMTLKDAIGGRCSVRAYSSEKIDKSTLQELMAAAVRAPTAMHAEPCQFVIVQDVSRLKRLSDRAKAVLATDARLHPDRHHADIFAQPDFNVFTTLEPWSSFAPRRPGISYKPIAGWQQKI